MVQVIFPVEVTHVPGHDLLLTSFQCRMTRMMLIFYGFLNLPGLIFGLCFVRNVKVTKCEKYLQAGIATP